MQRPTLLDAPDVNVRINRLIVIHRENVLSCSQLPVLYSSRCLDQLLGAAAFVCRLTAE